MFNFNKKIAIKSFMSYNKLMEKIDILIDMLKKDYSEEEVVQIISGLSKNKFTIFRVNTLKATNQQIEEDLIKNNIDFTKIDILDNVYTINNDKEEILKNLEIYKNGDIYLQNISSMLPSYFLDAKPNQDILDMCASPGGKTSLICAITENKSHIMACELHKQRYERLKYNLNKLNCKNVNVVQINANQLDDFYKFDRILLDAPCSGSGTLNHNDTKSYKNFSIELVNNCAKMQKSLLSKAIKLLKKGETMIYSTCSIIKRENEDIIKPFIENKMVETLKIDFIDKHIQTNLLSSTLKNAYTIKPSEYYEGFFICKLKKL